MVRQGRVNMTYVAQWLWTRREKTQPGFSEPDIATRGHKNITHYTIETLSKRIKTCLGYVSGCEEEVPWYPFDTQWR